MTNFEEHIEVKGARVHNLKNIDVTILREKLVVITGLSGSEKALQRSKVFTCKHPDHKI